MMLSTRSESNLKGVDAKLDAVVRLAFNKMADRSDKLSFIITEGVRTLARQKQLVAAGASRTMNSKHLTGRAVDLAATVAGRVRWDWSLYPVLASAMKEAAQELGVSIVWGGDWKTFRDGPHFELA